MYILAGILVFFVLVIIHELGHFSFAKKFGIKVLEFGVGIPPKIFTLFKDKSGTAYTLNSLPAGGFVRIKGEDLDDPNSFSDKDSLFGQPWIKQAWFLMGGILANILTAYLIFVAVFFLGTRPINIIPENAISIKNESLLLPSISYLAQNGFISGSLDTGNAIVGEILSGKIGEKIGLLSGDKIISINGQDTNILNIRNILQQNVGKSLELKIQRNGNIQTLNGNCEADSCILGVQLGSDSNQNMEIKKIKYPLGQAFLVAANEVQAQGKLTFYSLGNLGKKLFSFQKAQIQQASESLASPVASVKISQMILTNLGWIEFLAFGGIISLGLAFFNFLPIPALDGGRLLGITIQKILKLDPQKYYKKEAIINNIIFLMLMILGIYMMIRDFRIFWGWKI